MTKTNSQFMDFVTPLQVDSRPSVRTTRMDPIWWLHQATDRCRAAEVAELSSWVQYCVVRGHHRNLCHRSRRRAIITLWIIMNWIITVIQCKTRLVEGVPDSVAGGGGGGSGGYALPLFSCVRFPWLLLFFWMVCKSSRKNSITIFHLDFMATTRSAEWECPLSSSSASGIGGSQQQHHQHQRRINGSRARRNSNPCPSLFKRPRSSIQLPANL